MTRGLRRRLAALAAGGLCAALAALASVPAAAHRSGVSNVLIDIGIDGATVTTELAVKGVDLDDAMGAALVDRETDTVRPEVLSALAGRVAAHIVARAFVAHGDGTPCDAAPGAPAPDADGVILATVWRCEPGRGMEYRNRLFLEGRTLAIQNVLILRGDEADQDVLTADHDTYVLTEPPPSTLSVIRRYTVSGIEHIAIGYDHIAFLIALLLWARRFWPVAKAVTAFTAAHSVTLALAVLDIVSLPASVVEPLIAASIVWVAAENFFYRDIERRWRIAFLLGLVHGFGFAGVLRDFGLPPDALALALAFFNIGVEIGQVAIVAAAVPLLLSIDRFTGGARARGFVMACSAALALLGGYWLVERTLL